MTMRLSLSSSDRDDHYNGRGYKTQRPWQDWPRNPDECYDWDEERKSEDGAGEPWHSTDGAPHEDDPGPPWMQAPVELAEGQPRARTHPLNPEWLSHSWASHQHGGQGEWSRVPVPDGFRPQGSVTHS